MVLAADGLVRSGPRTDLSGNEYLASVKSQVPVMMGQRYGLHAAVVALRHL